VFAVIDQGVHGRAALDLALRVAHRKKTNLHAVLMPSDEDAGSELLDMVRDAGRDLGRRIPADVLSAPTAAQLEKQTPGGLVIIATNLADRISLARENFAGGKRCVVVVQGSDKIPDRSAEPEARNQLTAES
jgi:hypothetical protein